MAVEIVPKEPDTIEAGTRRFDLRSLWRLTAWGGAAALALAAAVFASQTESGSQRLAAFASADLPARPVATVKIPPHREQEWEIARLEAQLRTLTSDRDRLAERVASLEHNIEDITGSIKRQSAQTITPAPPTAATPVISPPATAEAKQSEKPAPAQKAEAAPPEPAAPEQTAVHRRTRLCPCRRCASRRCRQNPPRPSLNSASLWQARRTSMSCICNGAR